MEVPRLDFHMDLTKSIANGIGIHKVEVQVSRVNLQRAGQNNKGDNHVLELNILHLQSTIRH